MNKSIAALVLLASSSSAHALVAGDGANVKKKPAKEQTYCLAMYENGEGSVMLGRCDESHRNRMWGAKLNENGCADGQAAFVSVKVKIKACPTWVQL